MIISSKTSIVNILQHNAKVITTYCFSALASAVYASYDAQVNDDHSCDFSGTAERKYVLKDGDLGEQKLGQCLIKDGASSQDICGAMQWACYDQSYADVNSCFFINVCFNGLIIRKLTPRMEEDLTHLSLHKNCSSGVIRLRFTNKLKNSPVSG